MMHSYSRSHHWYLRSQSHKFFVLIFHFQISVRRLTIHTPCTHVTLLSMHARRSLPDSYVHKIRIQKWLMMSIWEVLSCILFVMKRKTFNYRINLGMHMHASSEVHLWLEQVEGVKTFFHSLHNYMYADVIIGFTKYSQLYCDNK